MSLVESTTNRPPKSERSDEMETLSEAVDRLERRGFVRAFRAVAEGMLELVGGDPIEPERLIVEEVVRFEGTSDPEDEAVLFALRNPEDDVRGTFVASYGVQGDPLCAMAVQRLDMDLDGRRPKHA